MILFGTPDGTKKLKDEWDKAAEILAYFYEKGIAWTALSPVMVEDAAKSLGLNLSDPQTPIRVSRAANELAQYAEQFMYLVGTDEQRMERSAGFRDILRKLTKGELFDIVRDTKWYRKLRGEWDKASEILAHLYDKGVAWTALSPFMITEAAESLGIELDDPQAPVHIVHAAEELAHYGEQIIHLVGAKDIEASVSRIEELVYYQ